LWGWEEMMNYFSIRIKLDDVIKDLKFEKKVIENIRYARKITGKKFRVIFWNQNLTEKQCKKFVERNEKILFEMTTKITKRFEYSWFLIKSDGDKSRWRYKSDEDILKGIASYIKLMKYMNERIETHG
jgi:hypothetical protein